jgi:hypothetical protein
MELQPGPPASSTSRLVPLHIALLAAVLLHQH